MDGVETTDNLELLREIENSPGDGSEEALTPYGAKCVADELERLRTALAQAERERDEARGLLRECLNFVDILADEKLQMRIVNHLRGEGD